MSSAPPALELFKGKDWEECDSFIRSIRARAWWEGKQKDSAWMAGIAAPQFSQKALSWHCRLPEDVQHDWSKLVIALLDRWPFPEDDDDAQILPTPAAAPSLNPNSNADHPLHGVLKVVLDESNTSYYVRFLNGATVCTLTTDASQAIRIRCNFVSGATLLERFDQPFHSWLATHWHSMPNTNKGSTEKAYMSFVHSDTLESTWSWSTPFQLLRCTVLANGELVPLWTKHVASGVTMCPFVGGGQLFLVADPVAYAFANKGQGRGRLFVEPTD